MLIRHAIPSDAEAIAEIYNDAVLNTTAIWNDNTVDRSNRLEWLLARQKADFPILVATDERGSVTGYATYGDWRPWDGYRHTVEHSVYVHPAMRGKGIGQSLMRSLIPLAVEQGKHIMVAGIESTNTASISLHTKLGFVEVGTLREVGIKLGRWLDPTFLQLRCSE